MTTSSWILLIAVVALALLGLWRRDMLALLVQNIMNAFRAPATPAAPPGHEPKPHGEGAHAHPARPQRPDFHRSGRRG
ncbi:hypothetical protein [Pelomonas sp. BJYL3]|uniref:hypothetical protein n=1 Tax=Pelomonas sp. BJYL3 TaxID=2976697 RepID=UPI0022B2D6D2|nr:hypothetical protein [Pelomonas sp. BJYL3]